MFTLFNSDENLTAVCYLPNDRTLYFVVVTVLRLGKEIIGKSPIKEEVFVDRELPSIFQHCN